ncbi:hypothetical protein [Mycobacterium sp. M26]|uniref:hypothetical protein n=1 Tax=Mycobacterium sp. M26 TaxID=1762962 RepID=UPI00073F5138|nr:hypothetical protein [Mycobacterium sp. M26]
MRRLDGELILWWTLPVLLILWVGAFLMFPGFHPPMAPTMPVDDVAAFYRDNTARVQYSMILFNWFGAGLLPILMLIAMQIRRMAHRTPILRYCVISCAAGGPTLFLVGNLFWLIAAFRPERAPELTQLLNDLAWIAFTAGVPFLIAQSVFIALAIFLDDPASPVLPRWVAPFNLAVAAALTPAAFTALAHDGPFAWNGALSFWLKNAAIAVWILVMAAVLGQAIARERRAAAVGA